MSLFKRQVIAMDAEATLSNHPSAEVFGAFIDEWFSLVDIPPAGSLQSDSKAGLRTGVIQVFFARVPRLCSAHGSIEPEVLVPMGQNKTAKWNGESRPNPNQKDQKISPD